MFEIAKRAGLLPSDIASYLGLNRVTVSLWMNGHSTPHKFLMGHVVGILDGVTLAVEDRLLPPPPELRRQERKEYVGRVLSKYDTHLRQEATPTA